MFDSAQGDGDLPDVQRRRLAIGGDMRLHQIIVGIVTIVTSLTILTTVVGVGAATAAEGTGMYTCYGVTGNVSFNPPLKPHGRQAETVKFRLTTSSCQGGTPTPKKVTLVATIHFPKNTCSSVQTGSGGGEIFYVPASAGTSTIGGSVNLGYDNRGNPTLTNADWNQVYGAYQSTAPIGAAFYLYTDFQNANRCTKMADIPTARLDDVGLLNF